MNWELFTFGSRLDVLSVVANVPDFGCFVRNLWRLEVVLPHILGIGY